MSASKQNSDSGLRTACGVFGCISTGEWPTDLDVAHIIYLGLIALQHRGQEGCGIVTSMGDVHSVQVHKRPGLVSQAFQENDLLNLQGNMGIGHTRYSTAGGTEHLNTQPFVVHTKHGVLAIAHNGELVNAPQLRKEIIEKGVGLSTESDSELMVQILCMPPPEPNNETEGHPDWPARIKNLMSRTKTSYSLLLMNGSTLYAVRDPFGNRPMCIGKLIGSSGYSVSNGIGNSNSHTLSNGNSAIENGFKHINGCVEDEEGVEGYVVSSESCAFPSVGAKLLREVEPGEIVEITKKGIKSLCIIPRPENRRYPALCVMEKVYFARPDSIIFGQMVVSARRECGKQLALQNPIVADIVSAVPESAVPAAMGFSEQSKIPYTEVLCKNRYVGRTFIQPTARLRKLALLKKFAPLSANCKGKKIVLVDDSIVRGNTMSAIIRMLREAGALEVHIRIASPPLHHPCYMGINIPTKEELIANQMDAIELAKYIGADSIIHLKVENLERALRMHIQVDEEKVGYCTACMTGKYPVELEW